MIRYINPLSANPTKWSSTLKQLAGNLPMNCLSVFDHFVKLALKRLMRRKSQINIYFFEKCSHFFRLILDYPLFLVSFALNRLFKHYDQKSGSLFLSGVM